MEPDLILCNIIQEFTGIAASRIVVYNQNYDPPTDPGIYIVVSFSESNIIANGYTFEAATNQYVYKTVTAGQYEIEITSKNRDALTRKEEIIQALQSYQAQQYEQLYNVSIYRPNSILDLSFIEGASSLHRYQMRGIIHSVKTITKTVGVYDKFRDQEVLN